MVFSGRPLLFDKCAYCRFTGAKSDFMREIPKPIGRRRRLPGKLGSVPQIA
jgi:hypothetical protein